MLTILVAIAAIFTAACLYATNILISAMAGAAWLAVMYWILENPVTGMAAGSPIQIIVMLALLGVALGLPIHTINKLKWSFSTSGSPRHGESSRPKAKGFSITRFVSEGDTGRVSAKESAAERQSNYRNRVHRALNQ